MSDLDASQALGAIPPHSATATPGDGQPAIEGGDEGDPEASGSTTAAGATTPAATVATATATTATAAAATKAVPPKFVVTHSVPKATITAVIPKVPNAVRRREYVRQDPSAELDEMVTQLLSTLYYYQERFRLK